MLKYTIGYTKNITSNVSDVYKKLSFLMKKKCVFVWYCQKKLYICKTIYNEWD